MSLAILIAETMARSGWSRGDLGRRFGYVDPGRALRRLDAFLAGALPDRLQAARLAKALGVSQADIVSAAEVTRIRRAETAQYVTEANEHEARIRFVPHIWAMTSRWKNPRPIFAVAVFGPEHFLRITLPQTATGTADEVIQLAGEHCRAHYARWKGRAGPFGQIEAYVHLQAWNVAWEFSTEGALLGRKEAFHSPPQATLALGNGESLRGILPSKSTPW